MEYLLTPQATAVEPIAQLTDWKDIVAGVKQQLQLHTETDRVVDWIGVSLTSCWL